MDVTHIPVLVPEGKQAGADLTMGELDMASYHLKCDVLEAFQGSIPGKRYAACVEVAYLWAKRSDPKADRQTFRGYVPEELFHALRMDGGAQEEPEPDPTESGDESSESQSP